MEIDFNTYAKCYCCYCPKMHIVGVTDSVSKHAFLSLLDLPPRSGAVARVCVAPALLRVCGVIRAPERDWCVSLLHWEPKRRGHRLHVLSLPHGKVRGEESRAPCTVWGGAGAQMGQGMAFSPQCRRLGVYSQWQLCSPNETAEPVEVMLRGVSPPSVWNADDSPVSQGSRGKQSQRVGMPSRADR